MSNWGKIKQQNVSKSIVFSNKRSLVSSEMFIYTSIKEREETQIHVFYILGITKKRTCMLLTLENGSKKGYTKKC